MPNIPKDIVAGPFYYAEQNSCLKMLTRRVWEINRFERRADCPFSSKTLERGFNCPFTSLEVKNSFYF